ncbi:hypothetical protein [Flavobacterium oreochromis]|nr:hypothetical protein [Flavobacterium oreochromis]
MIKKNIDLVGFLEEKQKIDPNRFSDKGYFQLEKLLRLKNENELISFLNSETPFIKSFSESDLQRFENYIKRCFTEEILEYYNKSLSEKEVQIQYFNSRYNDFKELNKSILSSKGYPYFEIIINELSFIKKNINDKYLNKSIEFVQKPVSAEIKETVFGKNYEFIENLYTNLKAKNFISESCLLEKFLQHFYLDQVPQNQIILIGNNQSDLGLLIDSLREFFKEDYRSSSFYNEFWANRFLFLTNGDSKKPKSKNKDSISKMVSEVKNGNRNPTKSNAISEIVENLKSIPL